MRINTYRSPEYISISHTRVCATYQFWFGWKTCINIIMKPTNSPNPRPTQPKKNQVKKVQFGHFSPYQIVFRGLGLILYRKQDCTKPNPTNFLGKHCNSVYHDSGGFYRRTTTFRIEGKKREKKRRSLSRIESLSRA